MISVHEMESHDDDDDELFVNSIRNFNPQIQNIPLTLIYGKTKDNKLSSKIV